LHPRCPHLPREIAQVPGRRGGVEGGAQGVPQALEQRALAFANRLREERRIHLLHRARLALGAGRPLAAVLGDALLLAEALAALGAAILVNRHSGANATPSGNRGQVDASPAVTRLLTMHRTAHRLLPLD